MTNGKTSAFGIWHSTLAVNGRSMRRMRGLADSLRHRRVRVDRPDELLDRAFEPERQGRLGNQFRRARTDHVHAEHLVVLLLGDDLHETLCLARNLGAPQDAEL